MTTEFDLNMHTARLLMDEPFFAAISRRIDKRASFALPTAGVMVNQDTAQFEMLYNPNFFATLTDAERQDVLKHEFYHIIFQHVTDRLPEEVNMKLWNVATDLAINSHLHNLPAGGLIPGEPDTPFADLPRGKSAEWYMANMPDFEDRKCKGDGPSGKGHGDPSEQPGPQGSGQGSGQGDQDEDQDGSGSGGIPDSLDDHSGWGECSQEVKDMARERLKDTVRKATEESGRSNSWGSVSASVRKDIMKMFETKIDWRKLLRYFVKTSQRSNKASSIKRINPRYPYIHPGRKTNRVAKVAISVDQSGSVDDQMLGLFFAELNKLSEIAEFVVIPFDTKVDDKLVYTWKKGSKKKPQRVMHGGTCFDAPTDYVNERGFDGHIVLTDMCAPKPKSSRCQRMWMTTPAYAARPYFETKERVIAIE
jgi:predicted metal-dependent peptidase